VTQIEAHGEQTERSSLPDQAPADLAARARQRIEAFANAQTKLLQDVEETNGNGSIVSRLRQIWRPNLHRSCQQCVQSAIH
jgi:hypothetical protein